MGSDFNKNEIYLLLYLIEFILQFYDSKWLF